MPKDRFDQIHIFAAGVVLLAMGMLLAGFSGGDRPRPVQNPSLERAMQDRARAAFLEEAFLPVEEMIVAGRRTEALLRLQEFEKEFPGEPHTMILRGGILVAQGGLGEGIAQYAAAVRLNGDYVDARSRLNRRAEIAGLVETAIPKIRRALASGDNPSLERSLRGLYYLQSRLAGGCE